MDQFSEILDKDVYSLKLQRILRACDRCSMASSKELRVPFLSPSLVEFARTIPPDYKIRNGRHRSFFVDSLYKLESEVIKPSYRNKKHVVDPQREWLYGPLKEYVMDTIDADKLGEITTLTVGHIKAYRRFLQH